MKITLTYHDDTSFTKEEVVMQSVHNYGKNVEVSIMPDSTKAHDLIYFGIQSIITHDQLGLLFNDKLGYQKSIQRLRNDLLGKLEEILSQVIIDNESKVS
jgi:hypothetical protein